MDSDGPPECVNYCRRLRIGLYNTTSAVLHHQLLVLASRGLNLSHGIYKKPSRSQSVSKDNLPGPSLAAGPMMAESSQLPPPTKASLKSWWNSFTLVPIFKTKAPEKEPEGQRGFFIRPRGAALLAKAPVVDQLSADENEHLVFGKPLLESLQFASVQISTANANGELYIWGQIPVVVAKWFVVRSRSPDAGRLYFLSGLYLKENGQLPCL